MAVQLAEVDSGEISIQVQGLLSLDTTNTLLVKSGNADRQIETVHVKAGDIVVVGDPLLSFDKDELERDIGNQNVAIEQTRLQCEIQEVQVLLLEEAISRLERDLERLNRQSPSDARTAAIRDTQDNLTLSTGSLRIARLQLESNRLTLDTAIKSQQELVMQRAARQILAPDTGMILSIATMTEGDRIAAYTPLFNLLPAKTACLQFRTAKAGALEPFSAYRVLLPDQILMCTKARARYTASSPEKHEPTSSKPMPTPSLDMVEPVLSKTSEENMCSSDSYNLYLDPDETNRIREMFEIPPEGLPARIEAYKRAAVRVPVDALMGNNGAPRVEVVDNEGTARIVTVQTGIIGSDYAEVLSGLEMGQLVRIQSWQ